METPPGPKSFFRLTGDDIKGRIREVIFFLPDFLKRPVEGMKRAPSWDWPTVLILEILLSALTSFLGGVLLRSFYTSIAGIFIGPISGLIITFLLSGFFYYTCLFWLKTELEFRKIYIVIVLALIPSEILKILSSLVRAAASMGSILATLPGLLGIILSSLLLIVGLSENFMLDKKKVSQMVGAIACFAIVLWLYAMVMDLTTSHIRVQDYTPESLDQIHKELEQAK